jgi:hypothetical protein
MGFWSELSQLGKDIGAISKECVTEIKQATADSAETFKEDPTKYTFDAAKDIGVFAGGAALLTGKVALKVGKHMISRANESREAAMTYDDSKLLDNLASKDIYKLTAAASELKRRGQDPEDIKFLIRSGKE